MLLGCSSSNSNYIYNNNFDVLSFSFDAVRWKSALANALATIFWTAGKEQLATIALLVSAVFF